MVGGGWLPRPVPANPGKSPQTPDSPSANQPASEQKGNFHQEGRAWRAQLPQLPQHYHIQSLTRRPAGDCRLLTPTRSAIRQSALEGGVSLGV
ncbi:hypothetical protein Pcinc_016060 [Petrolisthes cinctipes]|uniref:Uncharacterized protein n=1 Tax=Petrolisthes cinctipes TaxID=88211 RepID=A0AAE1FT56_PETCI|nr:hypothetical protein Pcinc_016060 [Petrolisthes cinctipes]